MLSSVGASVIPVNENCTPIDTVSAAVGCMVVAVHDGRAEGTDVGGVVGLPVGGRV